MIESIDNKLIIILDRVYDHRLSEIEALRQIKVLFTDDGWLENIAVLEDSNA